MEAWILWAAFLAVNLASGLFQKQISLHDGKGWEGVRYYQMAEQMAHGQPVASEGPFVFRLGTPFLTSLLLKDHLFLSFKIVNVGANCLALALLIVWLRLYVRDWKVRVLLGLLFLAQWDTPVRWVYFCPAHTDPWMWVFMLAGLIAVHHVSVGEFERRQRFWIGALCGIAFIGVLFREVVLLAPVALLFARNPIARTDGILMPLRHLRRPPPLFYLPLLAGLLGMLLAHRIARQTDDYSFLFIALHWAYEKPVLDYLHGWMRAFGPLLVLVIVFWRQAWAFLANHQFLGIYLLGCAVLGYVGGTDTERLLYWSMPVLFVLLGRAMEENKALLSSRVFWVVLILTQLISERAFWMTPDYPSEAPHRFPFLTPMTGQAQLLDMYSYFGNRHMEAISFVQYLLLGAVLMEWLNHRRRKMAEDQASGHAIGGVVLNSGTARHSVFGG